MADTGAAVAFATVVVVVSTGIARRRRGAALRPAHKPLQSHWLVTAQSTVCLVGERRPPPNSAVDDICVIGGGISGSSLAYWLTRPGSGATPPTVTVVEARGVAGGATGRNGGHLWAVVCDDYDDSCEMWGGARNVKQFAAFERRGVAAMVRIVGELSIDCDLEPTTGAMLAVKGYGADDSDSDDSDGSDADGSGIDSDGDGDGNSGDGGSGSGSGSGGDSDSDGAVGGKGARTSGEIDTDESDGSTDDESDENEWKYLLQTHEELVKNKLIKRSERDLWEPAQCDLMMRAARDVGEVIMAARGPRAAAVAGPPPAPLEYDGGVYFKNNVYRLHPAKLAGALAAQAEKAGARFRLSTRVTRVTRRGGAGYFEVHTDSGAPVKARRVVYATNAYTRYLLPDHPIAKFIKPVRNQVIVTKPLPGIALPFSLCMDEGHVYAQQRAADRRLVIGGMRNVLKAGELNEDNDGEDSLQPPVTAALHTRLAELLQIPVSVVPSIVEREWSGIMGFTRDELPLVGPVPGRPGQFISAGFSGHGMPLCLSSAEALAHQLRSIDGKSPSWFMQRFDPARVISAQKGKGKGKRKAT